MRPTLSDLLKIVLSPSFSFSNIKYTSLPPKCAYGAPRASESRLRHISLSAFAKSKKITLSHKMPTNSVKSSSPATFCHFLKKSPNRISATSQFLPALKPIFEIHTPHIFAIKLHSYINSNYLYKLKIIKLYNSIYSYYCIF